MEIAIHTWDVPVLPSPEEDIPLLLAEGVTSFEAGPHFFQNQPERVIEHNCRLFREAGIRPWSAHAPFGGQNDLSASADDDRRFAVETHKWFLERLAIGQVTVAVIHPGTRVGGDEAPSRWAALMHSLEELLPAAEQAQVKLALENLPPGYLGCEYGELLRAIESFDSPWLRVCFDSGHAHIQGQVAEGMDVLKNVICTFHLHDNDSTRDMHLQPPYGTIPWDGIRAVLDEMAFADPIAVEARPWQKSGYGQLCREVSALLSGQLVTVEVDGTPSRVRCARCGHYRFGPVGASRCACPLP